MGHSLSTPDLVKQGCGQIVCLLMNRMISVASESLSNNCCIIISQVNHPASQVVMAPANVAAIDQHLMFHTVTLHSTLNSKTIVNNLLITSVR